MSHKSGKIATLISSLEGQTHDPHYLGFFECFNHQMFFEAHEVLEELWLKQRGQDKDLFYKGLIQLAGAFVHVQKRRHQPALALFKLAEGNLARFGQYYEQLKILEVLALIGTWKSRLTAESEIPKQIHESDWPRLLLSKPGNLS